METEQPREQPYSGKAVDSEMSGLVVLLWYCITVAVSHGWLKVLSHVSHYSREPCTNPGPWHDETMQSTCGDLGPP